MAIRCLCGGIRGFSRGWLIYRAVSIDVLTFVDTELGAFVSNNEMLFNPVF